MTTMQATNETKKYKPVDTKTFAQKVGVVLGEKDKRTLYAIRVMSRICGQKFVYSCIVEAEAAHKASDLICFTEDKRRTFGGVFFKVAKGRMTGAQRWRYIRATRKAEKTFSKKASKSSNSKGKGNKHGKRS